MKSKLNTVSIFILIYSSYVLFSNAGTLPSINPSETVVIGETKILTLSASGGSSDEPDYDAPCPPWAIVVDSTVWSWFSSGSAIGITPNGNSVEVKGISIGEGEVYVNRNDFYSDASGTTSNVGSGVPSPDSTHTTLHVVKPEKLDSEKWFYVDNPASPIPPGIEHIRFWIIGNPGGVSYEWNISGPAQLEMLSYAPNKDVILAKATGGSDEISIEASVDGRTLGEVNTEIFTVIFAGNNLTSAVFFDDGLQLGWDQYNLFSIRDSNGGLIPEDIGLNENFGSRAKYIFNTWPSPEEVNATTSIGGGIDHYQIKKYTWQVLVTPNPEKDNSDRVFKINQKYRVGSSTSGQGTLIQEHQLIYYKGHVSIE